MDDNFTPRIAKEIMTQPALVTKKDRELYPVYAAADTHRRAMTAQYTNAYEDYLRNPTDENKQKVDDALNSLNESIRDEIQHADAYTEYQEYIRNWVPTKEDLAPLIRKADEYEEKYGDEWAKRMVMDSFRRVIQDSSKSN